LFLKVDGVDVIVVVMKGKKKKRKTFRVDSELSFQNQMMQVILIQLITGRAKRN
jgi:hypothetical protein